MSSPIVEIVGRAGACPDSKIVADRVSVLLGGSSTDAPHRASVGRDGQDLTVRFERPDGRLLAQRRLEGKGTCADLAEAAAVVIATWAAQFRLVLAPEPVISRPIMNAMVAAPNLGAERESPGLRLEVGTGLVAAAAQSRIAPGAAIVLHGFSGDRGIGARLMVAGIGYRTEDLGPGDGRARWARVVLGLGPDLRHDFGPWILDAHLGAQAALLHIHGEGYSQGHGDVSWELGFGAGLGVARRWAWAVPFVEAGVLAWPRQQDVFVIAQDRRATLPWLDAVLMAGVRIGALP